MTIQHTRVIGAALILVGACLSGNARAATIENFAIVNSTSVTTVGGQFDGGGTYSGSFSLDVDQTTTTALVQFSLTSFDIVLTGPVNEEISQGPQTFGTYLAQSFSAPIGVETVVSLDFQKITDQENIDLDLVLVEPPGAPFHGGLILDAQIIRLSGGNFVRVAEDTSGSASIVDPAVLAPEPGSAWLAAGGIGLLCMAARYRRH